jgi:hypothetical protein
VTTFLTALIIVVGIVCVLNLVLVFGVIRRLKEHDQALAKIPSGAGGSAASMRAPGSELDAFTAVSTDDVPVTNETLDAATLVGFFSVSCAPCVENAPKFAAHAAGMPGNVLTIVVADGDDDPAEMVGVLGGSARVVVEGYDGPMATAFGVTAFPAYAMVASGRITATALDVTALPVPAPA